MQGKLIGYHGEDPVHLLAKVTDGGYHLHVLNGNIWLDVAGAPIEGVCIGEGSDVKTAIEDAIEQLGQIRAALEIAKEGQ